jgi:glucans biosynthesis protein C
LGTDKNKELYFYNNVRSVIVLFVILIHIALAYCSQSKTWWIAVNYKSSLFAEIVSGSLDIFIMPVLFFISGYFTIGSYKKCSKLQFVIKKIKGLILPWFLGIIFLNPVLVNMIHISRGDFSVSFIDRTISYYGNFLSIPASFIQDRAASPGFFSHYHFWYLSLLFFFFIVFIVFDIGKNIIFKNKLSPNYHFKFNPYILLIIVIIFSSLWYTLIYTNLRESWFVFSVIQFQVSRIIPHLCFFIFGILSSKSDLNNSLLKIKYPVLLLIFTCFLTLVYLLFSRTLTAGGSMLNILVYSFSRFILCGLYLISILGTAKKYFNKETIFNHYLNIHSFGVYIIHLDVVILFTYLFSKLNILLPEIEILIMLALSITTCYLVVFIYDKQLQLKNSTTNKITRN